MFADEGLEARLEGPWASWFQHGEAACQLISGAAVTSYHRLGGLTNRISLSRCWRPEGQDRGGQGWFLPRALRGVHSGQGYPLLLGVGVLGQRHVQGTRHHPPRAFGGGHSKSPEGTQRGQATQEVERKAKEMRSSHLDPGIPWRGLSESTGRRGSAPWPLAGLTSRPTEALQTSQHL